jgi:hypothetical protein
MQCALNDGDGRSGATDRPPGGDPDGRFRLRRPESMSSLVVAARGCEIEPEPRTLRDS